MSPRLPARGGEVRTPSAGATGVIIETERLRMRAHRDDDLIDLVVLAGNWEIAGWTGTIPHPYSEIDGREWIALVQENHAAGQPRRFAIALKETDRLIGGVGLDASTCDGSDEPALGYWLGLPYWGNGYARKRWWPSSITGSGPSASKRSAPIPTQATRRRKRYFCSAA